MECLGPFAPQQIAQKTGITHQVFTDINSGRNGAYYNVEEEHHVIWSQMQRKRHWEDENSGGTKRQKSLVAAPEPLLTTPLYRRDYVYEAKLAELHGC